MNLAITLVHNKGDQGNIDQIEALKPFLTQVTDGPFTDPETGEEWTTIHHELVGLNIDHQVKVYQVVPYGVTPPPNLFDLNSGGVVQYGENDQDKVGNHPRFFNWGLKRATDYGADVSVYLEDVSKFNATKLAEKLEQLMDEANGTEYAEDVYGKIATVRLQRALGTEFVGNEWREDVAGRFLSPVYRKVPVLKEDRPLASAVSDLKVRVMQKGLRNG